MTEGQEQQQTKNLMDYHHEVLESQIEVQKQAFERIGSELYDNVGQMLSVAKIYLCTLEESALNEEQQNYVKQINEIVGKTIVDLRTLIRNLEAYLANNFDFSSSLGVELQRIRKTHKDASELMITGAPRSLGYEKEIVLFRIMQEMMNTLFTFGASDLHTELRYTAEQLTILIQYEGIKPNMNTLQQRTELIGGRCAFAAGPRKELKIEVPVRS